MIASPSWYGRIAARYVPSPQLPRLGLNVGPAIKTVHPGVLQAGQFNVPSLGWTLNWSFRLPALAGGR